MFLLTETPPLQIPIQRPVSFNASGLKQPEALKIYGRMLPAARYSLYHSLRSKVISLPRTIWAIRS